MKSILLNREDATSSTKFALSVAFELMKFQDRVKIVAVVAIQVFLALLDLLAIFLIGLITGLALSGIQSKSKPDTVEQTLELLQIENLAFQVQVALLGVSAAFLMIFKTITSTILVKKTLHFLALKAAAASSQLASRVIRQPYEYIKQQSSHSILYSVVQGTNSLIIGVLGSSIQIVSESLLICIMIVGLLTVEPIVSMSAIIYFALIAIVQQRQLGNRATVLGGSSANSAILVNKKILESLTLYREIYVRNAGAKYSQEIKDLRQESASIVARISFLPYISKYTLEIALVFGALLLSAFQFLLSDSARAVTVLAVFLAAATRVSPALLRLQQSLIAIRSNIGAASTTINLFKELGESKVHEVDELESCAEGQENYEILLKDVTFAYQNSRGNTLKNISLQIRRGDFVAIVGPSGSGKSTLVDLILGLLTPQSGQILIRGKSPQTFVKSFPGCIGYVPQDSNLVEGTIRENLTFGLSDDFHDDHLFGVLELVSMLEFVQGLSSGLDEMIGERGSLISGGQRQRLNIARAVVTNPEILILDEATSALDVDTEKEITASIDTVRVNRTLIVIAHRLSTVLRANNVVFLKDGKILGQGTFNELRKSLPDFENQAQLSGLTN
jgi:ABC-type multidrug transport system fused ATPase/permease subunit